MSVPEPQKQVKRPRLRLPFENRKQDAGSWAYDHRVGLCVTLIAYLLLMIVFVTSKIVVGGQSHTQGMLVDLQTLTDLEQQRDQLEKEVRERQLQQGDQIDWRSIRNDVSNENSLNEKLRDDRGTNTSAINEAAEAVAGGMQANREAYERGLALERSIREGRGQSGDKGDKKGAGSEGEDHKVVKGHVVASFSLSNPVRTARHLHIPAYKCEAGGDVEVEITVNRAGEVINARVVEGGDGCMRESALESARQSLFNIDNAAPARQTGTITYIFIPQ